MNKRVVIVGGGFGGLASAALLAKKGCEVTLIEKNKQLGGRARTYQEKGFTFDMGPSWYLMPDAFERFFEYFNVDPKKELQLQRLDPSYRIFFGGEDVVDVSSDLEKNKELFESFEKGGAKQLQAYLDDAKYCYNVAMGDFIYRKYTKLSDLFDWRLVKQGLSLRVFTSMEKYTKKFFTSDRAQKILQYTIVFLGGTPAATPAMYSLMAHVDFNLGVWYPKGGMAAVAQYVAQLGTQHGVTFVTDEPVEKIEVEDGKATQVRTANGTYDADIVLVNADYQHADTMLLDEKHRSYSKKYWDTRVIAPSGFIMYIGLDKKVESLKHHSLFLDNDWKRHFNTIFSKPSWPKSPSYYVCCPSKTDKDVAPEGCENLFVLVPVASGLKDTQEVRDQYEKQILDHLENLTREDIRSHVVVKRIYAHNDFQADYNSFKGTALGLAHTLHQTAIYRPSQKSKKVSNLYFTGHYVHPGVGVPMTLISAELVVKQIENEQL